jgi:hypothetical protein
VDSLDANRQSHLTDIPGETTDATDIAQNQLPQPWEITQFATISDRIFSRIDTHHKGILTRQDLALAVENTSFHGQEAAVVVALYELSSKTDLPDHNGEKGYSRSELADLELQLLLARRQSCLVPEGLSAANLDVPNLWAQMQFAFTNKKYQDRIVLDDIDKAIASSAGDDLEHQSLRFFRRHYAEIEGLAGYSKGSGLIEADLEIFAKKFVHSCGSLWTVNGTMRTEKSLEDRKVLPRSSKDINQPKENITYSSIEQGELNDCHFEASLSAVAKADNQSVNQMVSIEKDRNYKVVFPGAPGPYVVFPVTEAEMILGNRTGGKTTAAEKAAGLWRHELTHHGRREEHGEVPQMYMDPPGNEGLMIQLLTNHKVDRLDLTCDPSLQLSRGPEWHCVWSDDLQKALLDNITHKRAMVASREIEQMLEDKILSLPARHDYAILGYDPNEDSQQGGTLSIRNPHGLSGKYGSEFKMTLNEFLEHFGYVTEETDERLPEEKPTTVTKRVVDN